MLGHAIYPLVYTIYASCFQLEKKADCSRWSESLTSVLAPACLRCQEDRRTPAGRCAPEPAGMIRRAQGAQSSGVLALVISSEKPGARFIKSAFAD